MEKTKPTPARKVAGSSIVAAPAAAIIAWAWNGFVGEPTLTPEVAGAMGGIIGPVVAYAVSWLPRPGGRAAE